jgi:hypothetical protein
VRAPKAADQPAPDNDATLTARYEQLRQVALSGNAEGWRHGLGVLTTHGVTGWMHACRTIPPPPAAPRRVAANPIAVDDAAEIVAVMAAMALAHL